MCVTLWTALRSTRADRVRLYLLEDDIRSSSKARIERVIARAHPCVSVRWIGSPDPALLASLPQKFHLTRAAYLRLWLPELVEPDVRRLVYVDSDTLVRADLLDLQSELDPACMIAAAPEFKLSPGDEETFSTGVFVADMQVWRDAGVARQVFDWVQANADICWLLDQSGLNAVLKGRWQRLSPLWNYAVTPAIKGKLQQGAPPPSQALPLVNILHYTTPNKPWNSRVLHPLHRIYFKALRESGALTPVHYLLYEAKALLLDLWRYPRVAWSKLVGRLFGRR